MSKSTQMEARIENLQAAVLVLCAVLPAERATFTKGMFFAALEDLDDRSHPRASGNADADADADADAVSADMVAKIIKTLDYQLPG